MRWVVIILLICAGLVLSAGRAVASMSLPQQEKGAYECLQEYTRFHNIMGSRIVLGFLVPGFDRIKHGDLGGGMVQLAIEAGALFFLIRLEEVNDGGDIYRVFSVNWWALLILTVNHCHSGFSVWQRVQDEQSDLRLRLGINQICLGLHF